MITRALISGLLKPGAIGIFGQAKVDKPQWESIFTQHVKSDKAVEVEYEMKFTGYASVKPEGTPIAVDDMQQAFQNTYEIRSVGLSFIITQEAIEDNLYKDRFPVAVRSLRHSMEQTQETLAAAVINNGFDPSFALSDGLPLFSLDHPLLSGGVQANTPAVPSDLNEESALDGTTAVRRFRDVAGLIAHVNTELLVVPPEGEWVASRLCNSQYQPDTGNNAINPIVVNRTFPKGYVVNQYLTDPTFWMIKSNYNNGFKFLDRTPLQIDVYGDFDTKSAKCSAWMRYAYGVATWKAAYGSRQV